MTELDGLEDGKGGFPLLCPWIQQLRPLLALETLSPQVIRRLDGVLFDLDDTFTTEGKIPSCSFAALWDLKKRAGLALIPVTGRPGGWCDHIARMWPVDGEVGENVVESGLCFAHAHGTSGGTINLAMLLSGLSLEQMCDRWRTLKVADFVSFMPLEQYLHASQLMGMGDADGIIGKVFPHLGIDISRINAAQGMDGTFNICNYSRKTNEVMPHRRIDLDLLVAGISLPMFMPPVRKGTDWYTDSVWIKDANLMEAVRRGADELWLVWCIGNSQQYKAGLFNQYVHMIEMIANGALFEEFNQIRDINARIAAGEVVER